MQNITGNLKPTLTINDIENVLREKFPEFVGILLREYGFVAYFYHVSGVRLTYNFGDSDISKIDIFKHLPLIKHRVVSAIVNYLFDEEGII